MPGDDGRLAADRLERGLVEQQSLVVGERRRLARRARHDDAVRAVLDEVAAQGPERIQVDRAVRAERGDDGSQDLAEHARGL